MDTATALAHQNSKYRTRPFEDVLKSSFPAAKHALFGRYQEDIEPKVAVTATTDTFQTPVLLANYNRPQPKSGYCEYRW